MDNFGKCTKVDILQVQHIKYLKLTEVQCDVLFLSVFWCWTVKNERVSRISQKLPGPLTWTLATNGWLYSHHSAWLHWQLSASEATPSPLAKPWIQPDLLIIFWTKTKVSAIVIITCTSHKFQYTFFCTIPWVSLQRRRKRELESPVNSPVRTLVILYCKVRDLYDRHFTVKKMINFRK